MEQERLEELTKEFAGLTKSQKELLLCRKINELKSTQDSLEDFDSAEESFYLALAADVGFFKPFLFYTYNSQKYELEKKEIYKDSLIHYNHVLENYKNLAEDLHVSTSLDLSHLFSYLLWNGYFSVDKKHVYQLQERLLLPGLYSLDVIKGKGVCLSYAELLHNYLSVCGKDSSLLLCKVPKKRKAISFDYRPEIVRNRKINIISIISNHVMSFFLSGLINQVGNHAVTLVEENGMLYVYDATNLCALNIKDASTASIINGKGEFQIKPSMTFMVDSHVISNPIHEKLLLGDIGKGLSRKEFIFSFENLMELVNNNISLLDDAYDNIHNDLEFISRQIDEIGNRNRLSRRLEKNKKI